MKAFNGKCINSNAENPELASLPRYDVLKVGERNVVVTGLLPEDTSIYAPTNTPTVTAAPEAAAKVWEAAKAQLGGLTPDLHLPMTHALVPEGPLRMLHIAVTLTFTRDAGPPPADDRRLSYLTTQFTVTLTSCRKTRRRPSHDRDTGRYKKTAVT